MQQTASETENFIVEYAGKMFTVVKYTHSDED